MPEQVPGVLLLAHGSLDGATYSNIHPLNNPNVKKGGLTPGPELPALPSQTSPFSSLHSPMVKPLSRQRALQQAATAHHPVIPGVLALQVLGRSAQEERIRVDVRGRRCGGGGCRDPSALLSPPFP